MGTSSDLRLILRKLRDAIAEWDDGPSVESLAKEGAEANVEQEAQKRKPLSFPQKIKAVAKRLKVTDKTLSNWLNHPLEHPISLKKLLDLCDQLSLPIQDLIPECPRIEAYEKIALPLKAENALLEIENKIPDGKCKRVAFPLWSSVLFLEKLTNIYATKGLYRYFDVKVKKPKYGDVDCVQKFLSMRRERQKLYEGGKYIFQLVFMRDEMEKWINGERLYKGCSAKDCVKQIDHILKMLTTRTRNQKLCLELRLTKSYLRAQYGIFDQPGGLATVILNTNAGYVKIQNERMQDFFNDEFRSLWNNGTYKNIRTTETWVQFLGMIKQKIFEKEKWDKENPDDKKRIDLKAILDMTDCSRTFETPSRIAPD